MIGNIHATNVEIMKCSSLLSTECCKANQLQEHRGRMRDVFRPYWFLPYLLMLYHQCAIASAFTLCRHSASQRHAGSPLFARGKSSTKQVPIILDTSRAIAGEDASVVSSTIVVLDVENIRGANSFRISHEALLSRIRLWREDRLEKGDGTTILEPMIWVSDHGIVPSVHHFSSSRSKKGLNYNGVRVNMPNNFGLAFAGDRTADDIIVDLVKLRCGTTHNNLDNIQPYSLRNTTIVITADAKLISRCQEARRQSTSFSDVIFVEPASLLQQLELYKINTHEEENLFGESSRTTSQPQLRHRGNIAQVERRIEGKTNTMTSFKDSTIAMEQHARFQARFQNRQNSSISCSENVHGHTKEEDDTGEVAVKDQNVDKSDENIAALDAKLKTEQIRRQLLLSDAFYLARPEKLRGRRSASTMAAIHAKYKDRNISKKQQKRLYKKRYGRQRNEEMTKAAMTRKALAKKLQLHIEGLVEIAHTGEVIDKSEYRTAKGGSECLLHHLLRWFEQEKIKWSAEADDKVDTIHYGDLQGLPMQTRSSERDDGHLASEGSWDPLGSVLQVPLRDSISSTIKPRLAPMRIVVISDTHGFEGSLAKFDQDHQRNDDYLLPQADLLIHCGDFAASGSRKSQRAAARRLDNFIARQTHIPEKLIIKGNHDPDSPAKILFPNSKALYARASSTLVVNGVTFALEPYSKRVSFRSIGKPVSPFNSFPFCDVLVSHEPPKGVLDLTYHGFSAGSSYLRDVVTTAKTKPRLWLCGHIHEGRGILTKCFAEEKDDQSKSTIVVNASNANSGKANRLVSGAVIVDIERNHVNEMQTAERTIQLRDVSNEDGYITDGLAGLENMELFETRPGVRRRKGVPHSVRRQRLELDRSLTKK
eukprot:CCRYP_013190-RA/>CCRYP_013190-RA protein AED:0.03 eAED:0.03 QI:179/1/1/1/0.75/0.6/5/1611/876